MYARVASWEGGSAEDIQRMKDNVDASEGPPEGVPATGFMMLVDRESGRGLAIALFETEEDMRTGDEALNRMNPPEGTQQRRVGVDFYEVAVNVTAPG